MSGFHKFPSICHNSLANNHQVPSLNVGGDGVSGPPPLLPPLFMAPFSTQRQYIIFHIHPTSISSVHATILPLFYLHPSVKCLPNPPLSYFGNAPIFSGTPHQISSYISSPVDHTPVSLFYRTFQTPQCPHHAASSLKPPRPCTLLASQPAQPNLP